MTFQLFDVVKAKAPVAQAGLPAGSEGTVVIVFDESPPAYEVEFADDKGQTVALVVMTDNQLELAI